MSIQRPRRIFRSQRLPVHSGATLARGLAGALTRPLTLGVLGTLAAVVVVAIAAPSNLFGRVPALSGTVRADSVHVAVVDGQTLRLGESVVRLQGVDAPVRGELCRKPDGTGFDCGAEASARLAKLVRGRSVSCQLVARDIDGVLVARCAVPGTDLNASLTDHGIDDAANAATAKVAQTLRTP